MLESAVARDQMHHALLLHGQAGLGKHQFGERLAAVLLCESNKPASQRPCGECRGCRLLAAGSHPDSLQLAPEEGKVQISVEQVRRLISDNVLTSHYAGYRIIVLTPAHSLTASAANALLKTLEEPPEKHVFVLLAERLTGLPITLRSRCLSLLFSAPDQKLASDWLARESTLEVDWPFLLKWNGGAPLAALEASAQFDFNALESSLKGISDLVHGRIDPIVIADQWRKTGLYTNLNWQHRLLGQLLRCQVPQARNDFLPPYVLEIASKLDFAALGRIYDELLELRDAQLRNLHPNEQLALEGLAATWQLASGHGPAPH